MTEVAGLDTRCSERLVSSETRSSMKGANDEDQQAHPGLGHLGAGRGREHVAGRRIGPFTVIFEDRQQHDVDTNGAAPNPGDYYVFAQRLENPRGKTVGNLYGRCTSHFDGMELCEGVFKITRKGDISVQTAFPADFSEPVTLAVNGGTGRYQGADGQANFTQFADGRFGVVFELSSGD